MTIQWIHDNLHLDNEYVIQTRSQNDSMESGATASIWICKASSTNRVFHTILREVDYIVGKE